ncbi:hypothetical protein M011DRAFT_286138 [Sporormia fimetaria CBS 119925]|uniref:Uncharacterized protein n=1 Tax=Sporormia fimetaria CBS 119925 TaxID=1340428 RepID=A0A6A6VJM9_9PLEO|nr:hypothetical protein M011DRAFT_286138 [Sporormia fimetaria CBS 119925]
MQGFVKLKRDRTQSHTHTAVIKGTHERMVTHAHTVHCYPFRPPKVFIIIYTCTPLCSHLPSTFPTNSPPSIPRQEPRIEPQVEKPGLAASAGFCSNQAQ